jgi:uncharacterized cofD-like protein
MKKVVTIGGGTGHAQVLKGIRDIPDIKITSICPSTDSGGSTGVLQKEYGGNGYTGDLTKCIIALCGDEILSKALSFRYEKGPLHSHSVKNLLFHALEKVSTYEDALRTMWNLCGLGQHRVLPVTREKTELCATLHIGTTISGETNIDMIARNPLWNPGIHSISDIFLKPQVQASSLVVESILEADHLIICPGDLYSSIIPVLLPVGMKAAVRSSPAKITLILNIMTKEGETDDYAANDFVDILEERLGRKADRIICNDSPITETARLRYSLERKVELGTLKDSDDPRLMTAPLAMVTDGDRIMTDPSAINSIFRIIIGLPSGQKT